MPTIKAKFIHSSISAHNLHKLTIRALGFRKLNSTVILTDTPQIRGMLNHVKHLVSWEVIN